jgi:7-carboxy-7-deazaguanine synthase (Cx14CxxC type)
VYQIKEIFYTLQGEGANAGRPAVFCRFAGCNLWSGSEADRRKSLCSFCDTDFVGTDGVGGGTYESAEKLAAAIFEAWPRGALKPFLVFTGGEPLLQLDAALVAAVRALKLKIAVETNGSLMAPSGIDWLTVSPKPGAPFLQRKGDELKLVYPQGETDPQQYEDFDFCLFYLSPLVCSDLRRNEENMMLCRNYCLANPKWRLTGQNHKLWRLP